MSDPMKHATIARLTGNAGMTIESATVRSAGSAGITVQNAVGVFQASRAFSCLVEPREGDIIMLARDGKKRCHVLAVLDRPGAQDAAIHVQGKLDVHAKGIAFTTPGEASTTAARISINTVEANMNAVSAKLGGQSAELSFRNIRSISDRIETIANHCTQRFQVSIRWITELEDVTAGQLVQKVKGLFASRSRQALITAEDDVKVDAKRIHMG
ncbi:MAG: DUF3540 domain-containing protein [Proteobacteria bacterium]|nr:DUF3540 domain-containing protein [Pseudomonadota bacterium]